MAANSQQSPRRQRGHHDAMLPPTGSIKHCVSWWGSYGFHFIADESIQVKYCWWVSIPVGLECLKLSAAPYRKHLASPLGSVLDQNRPVRGQICWVLLLDLRMFPKTLPNTKPKIPEFLELGKTTGNACSQTGSPSGYRQAACLFWSKLTSFSSLKDLKHPETAPSACGNVSQLHKLLFCCGFCLNQDDSQQRVTRRVLIGWRRRFKAACNRSRLPVLLLPISQSGCRLETFLKNHQRLGTWTGPGRISEASLLTRFTDIYSLRFLSKWRF